MKNRPMLFFPILLILMTAACTSTQNRERSITEEAAGIYLIAYVDFPKVRQQIEDRLLLDLAERNIKAYASYQDIERLEDIRPQIVKREAQEKQVLAVLVIKHISSDIERSGTDLPERISPKHPTLKAFYQYSRNLAAESYSEDGEVFAEVNLFVLDDGIARLFWSGTTWSFSADEKGSAIRDISKTIADQLVQLKLRFR